MSFPVISPEWAQEVRRKRLLYHGAGLNLFTAEYFGARMVVIPARSLANARREAREEFGIPSTRLNVHESTDEEIAYFMSSGGQL